MQRRSFLAGLSVLSGLSGLGVPMAFAAGQGDARLVVIVLRGGLDGLAAVPAYGDPDYAAARGRLALPRPGEEGGAVDLDGTFGLHPGLAPLEPLYDRGELLVLHAAAPPYQDHSHFDGQNVLENGTSQPFGARTGWLNRALTHLHGAPPAMAVGRSVPLLLRGPARVASADPLRPARGEDPFLERITALYRGDTLLEPALREGMEIQAMLARHQGPTPAIAATRERDGAKRTVEVIARVLAAPDGPRVAVLEMTGWDTHANQDGVLGRQLGALGEALAAFSEAMPAEAWRHTVVLAVTEFGRTVAGNGTGGSDHGVGGAGLVVGGAVRGGRVLADWPGLASKRLLGSRDLRPTTDLRAVFKGVLHDHLNVSSAALEDVFPDSRSVKRLADLIRPV